MTYSPVLLPFILSAVLCTGLILYSLPLRNTSTGRAYLRLMGLALVWTVGFALESASGDLETKLMLSRFQFLAITFLPAAWVDLVFNFMGVTRPRRDWFLLLFVPVLTNIVIWTNPLHHLFWGNPRLVDIGLAVPILDNDYQFWFYGIHAPYGYLVFLVALLTLVTGLVKAQPVYRNQGYLLLAAILLPLATDLTYVLGYSPIPHYNLTTAMFSISGLIMAWTLLRYKFLDLLPLARNMIFEHMGDGMLVLDRKGRLIDFNPAARQMIENLTLVAGYSVEQAEAELLRQVETMVRDEQSQADVELGDPLKLHYELRRAPVRDHHGASLGQIVSVHDITERVELLQRVQALAMSDDLTGIFNRRKFMELAAREFERLKREPGHSLAVILLDVDQFNAINYAFGHPGGDKALVELCNAVKANLRAVDIFARLGGDEFAILLTGASLQEALRVTARLSHVMADLAIDYEGRSICLTVSMGAVCSAHLASQQKDIEIMLRLADHALYQAKAAGRNQVVFHQ